MNMAVLEHKRERNRSPPIEVKSKFCSGLFLSFRMVDIIEIIRETLKNILTNSELQKKYI
jgi:hypothetical protein